MAKYEQPSDECIESVRRWECSLYGHEIMTLILHGSIDPYELYCERCGEHWKVEKI